MKRFIILLIAGVLMAGAILHDVLARVGEKGCDITGLMWTKQIDR